MKWLVNKVCFVAVAFFCILQCAQATLPVYYDIQVTRLQYYGESGDACKGPDPRWKVSVSDETTGSWYGEYTWEKDDINPTYTYDVSDRRMRSTSSSSASQLQVRMQGWEEDSTSGDDGVTGYNHIGTINFRNEDSGTYNTFRTYGWYSISSDGYGYRVEVKVNWYYSGSCPAPGSVSATDTDSSKVRVSWNAVSDAEYYEVYRNTLNSSGGATRIAYDKTGTSYDDTTAVQGQQYYYWVRAYRSSNHSSVKSHTLSAYSTSNAGKRPKQSQTISFNTLSDKAYGDAGFSLSAAASSGLPVSFASRTPNVISVNGSTVSILSAGTATIRATQSGDSSYEAAADVDRTFTIEKAGLTATVSDAMRSYGDSNPVFVINYSGFVNDENESVLDIEPSADTTADVSSDAGSYTVTVSGGFDNNYSMNNQNGTLTVEPRALTATADDKSRAYGEDNPEFTLSYNGFVNGDDNSVLDVAPVASCDAAENSQPGTYPIEVNGGADNNYSISGVDGTLTIGKAFAEIILEGTNLVYNGEGREVVVITTPQGLETETTYDELLVFPTNAAVYEVVSTVVNSNYQGVVTNSLVINPKELTVTADDLGKKVGEADPELTYSAEGLIGADVLSGELTREAGEDAGTYAIQLGTLSAGQNYMITFTGAVFTVTAVAEPEPFNITAPAGSAMLHRNASNERVMTAELETTDGVVYKLMASSSLEPGSFIEVDRITGNGGKMQLNFNCGNAPKMFFKVVTE